MTDVIASKALGLADNVMLLHHGVVQPLAALDAQRCADERERTETSRVRFYTLQPENT